MVLLLISFLQKRRCDIPKKSPYQIILSSYEKKFLQQLAQKYTSPYFEVIRAKAIMFAADDLEMNYPAASSGVSSKALNAPRGGETPT